jgi:hypothetical protein
MGSDDIRILDRALTTIDRNPQILESLLKTVETDLDAEEDGQCEAGRWAAGPSSIAPLGRREAKRGSQRGTRSRVEG